MKTRFLCLALSLAAAASLQAQTTTIIGSIDPDTVRPAFAVLSERGSDTGRIVPVDPQGRFLFLGVRPARAYKLEIRSMSDGYYGAVINVAGGEVLRVSGHKPHMCSWINWQVTEDWPISGVVIGPPHQAPVSICM